MAGLDEVLGSHDNHISYQALQEMWYMDKNLNGKFSKGNSGLTRTRSQWDEHVKQLITNFTRGVPSQFSWNKGPQPLILGLIVPHF